VTLPSLRRILRGLLVELRTVDDGVCPPATAGLPFSTGQLRALRAGRAEPPAGP
jgi:hypothetical protein